MSRQVEPSRIECVDDEVARILRKNGPAASVEMIASAWRFMRTSLEAQIRFRHPTWEDAQIAREVSRRLVNGST